MREPNEIMRAINAMELYIKSYIGSFNECSHYKSCICKDCKYTTIPYKPIISKEMENKFGSVGIIENTWKNMDFFDPENNLVINIKKFIQFQRMSCDMKYIDMFYEK